MTETIQGVKLVLADAHLFSDCISAINRLVDETTIHITPTHLEITALDPANVAMIVFKMEAREFVGYSVEADTKFAIKLPSLKQVLSRSDKDSTLSLALDNNRLIVTISGKTRKEFVLPLIELEEKQQKMPELKWNVEVSLDNSELREAVADVGIVGESCEFKVVDKKFIVSAANNDTKAKAVSETKAVVKELGEDKTAGAKFSIEYLDKMLSTKLSKNARLFLAKDYPMKIIYVNDSGSTSINFLLAPRIDTD